ncbi:hypothetical protein PNK_0649 [Candidatus Protochlamydia naegleriophila]|uniref:Uncharacterized protein n=1 Tax=Candidatus Protochlamydia naegleriophila TaxID=389348 RepID=A0A0U5JBW1_9BACT|nr:hypothetical protein [Candidatus Protochlamydia naegleriophila]CUI16276.1 hypothetical protein PNK_0649 [Candidatus Protochlamydia naegleriophila]
MELLLGKQNEAIVLQKKSDPCLLLLAGTRISYAKHLASEEQYDEAIEQIKKAQVIYDQIDFAQLANQSHSKVAFLNNCVQLIKEYQSIK